MDSSKSQKHDPNNKQLELIEEELPELSEEEQKEYDKALDSFINTIMVSMNSDRAQLDEFIRQLSIQSGVLMSYDPIISSKDLVVQLYGIDINDIRQHFQNPKKLFRDITEVLNPKSQGVSVLKIAQSILNIDNQIPPGNQIPPEKENWRTMADKYIKDWRSNTCYICGVNIGKGGVEEELEHILPVGMALSFNMIIQRSYKINKNQLMDTNFLLSNECLGYLLEYRRACKCCNRIKGMKSFIEFRANDNDDGGGVYIINDEIIKSSLKQIMKTPNDWNNGCCKGVKEYIKNEHGNNVNNFVEVRLQIIRAKLKNILTFINRSPWNDRFGTLLQVANQAMNVNQVIWEIKGLRPQLVLSPIESRELRNNLITYAKDKMKYEDPKKSWNTPQGLIQDLYVILNAFSYDNNNDNNNNEGHIIHIKGHIIQLILNSDARSTTNKGRFESFFIELTKHIMITYIDFFNTNTQSPSYYQSFTGYLNQTIGGNVSEEIRKANYPWMYGGLYIFIIMSLFETNTVPQYRENESILNEIMIQVNNYTHFNIYVTNIKEILNIALPDYEKQSFFGYFDDYINSRNAYFEENFNVQINQLMTIYKNVEPNRSQFIQDLFEQYNINYIFGFTKFLLKINPNREFNVELLENYALKSLLALKNTNSNTNSNVNSKRRRVGGRVRDKQKFSKKQNKKTRKNKNKKHIKKTHSRKNKRYSKKNKYRNKST